MIQPKAVTLFWSSRQLWEKHGNLVLAESPECSLFGLEFCGSFFARSRGDQAIEHISEPGLGVKSRDENLTSTIVDRIYTPLCLEDRRPIIPKIERLQTDD